MVAAAVPLKKRAPDRSRWVALDLGCCGRAVDVGVGVGVGVGALARLAWLRWTDTDRERRR